MIQRIQTLYLLIVTTLQTILLFSNIISVSVPGGESFTVKCTAYWPVVILIVLTILLAFFSIFLYRRRIVQIRINVYNILILLALQGYLVYHIITIIRKMAEAGSYSFSIPTVFPIISAILTFLAIRNIGKDEALIKALNRIR